MGLSLKNPDNFFLWNQFHEIFSENDFTINCIFEKILEHFASKAAYDTSNQMDTLQYPPTSLGFRTDQKSSKFIVGSTGSQDGIHSFWFRHWITFTFGSFRMQKTRKFQEDIHEYKYFKGKNGHFWAHTHLLAEKITNKICTCRIDLISTIYFIVVMMWCLTAEAISNSPISIDSK